MNRFLILVLSFFAIPLILLGVVYVVTDPYRTLRPFSLDYFDDTNRDYLSSELWLMNYPKLKYDSYIFGSSRGCGINTYHWLSYLPEGSKQFLFQAWGETLTGIEQKINYLDKNGCNIRNVILLIDYPGSFIEKQFPTEALSIKHPLFSGQRKLVHEVILFWNFIQKPSQWLRAFEQMNEHPVIGFDTESNDWDRENKYRELAMPPAKDSLKNCSELLRNVFLHKYSNTRVVDLPTCKPCIKEHFEKQLRRIKAVFDRHNTNYRIVITPGYCYSDPKVNEVDLEILCQVFGKENVYDFSGKNFLTEDYNNYSDPGHFGLWVGWHMIETIYNDDEKH